MIKINPGDISVRKLTLDAVNMEADHWVYGCKRTENHRNSRVCVESESLSAESTMLPSRGKRKMIQLDMMEMDTRGFSHIVVNIPKDSDKSKVNIDLYNITIKEWTDIVNIVDYNAPGSSNFKLM